MEEYSQTVSEYLEIMAQKKREFFIAEKSHDELVKRQKEELKIKYAECYKQISDKGDTSDTKAKSLAYCDEDYKNFLKNQMKEMSESIENLGQKTKEYEISLGNYYIATNKRTMISDGVKLWIGGFFEAINEQKVQDEVQELKKKRLINIKNKK